MPFEALSTHRFFRPAIGALLSAGIGLMLLCLSWGDPWVDASYDNLFRFGTRNITNKIALVLMDNEAYADPDLNQSRDSKWDRAIHARLLNQLADDKCPLVVMDVTLLRRGDAEVDAKLMAAMARLTNIVLAAEHAGQSQSGRYEAIHPTLPEPFLAAAKNNWGDAAFDPDPDSIVRRHWPYPSPGPHQTLPWVAAKLSGAKLDDTPVERWFRYYDFDHAFTSLSYPVALRQSPGYFSDKVVFIGNDPHTTVRDHEVDEFCPPQFNWTDMTVGGVKINATEYVNLVNGDWLRRFSWLEEMLLVAGAGSVLGIGLTRFRRGIALALGAAAGLAIFLAGISLSYFSNHWFPWLIVLGAQLPCALIWAAVPVKVPLPQPAPEKVAENIPAPKPGTMVVRPADEDPLPDAPEYELIQPPVGSGGFGKVWIAKNAIGQWQALKTVYASKFNGDQLPYETEFKGLQRYKPVSEKHPGLLRIELISRMKEKGYFYYVMELGDALTPGWESQPQLYKPRDLENLRRQAAGRRLPISDCLRIITPLADALHYLHEQGLTHRDIKPANVIFVKGRPKLADIGLITDIRPGKDHTLMVGTLGYMPLPPEKTGTVQADIYALGMVLYVISTGRDPDYFPDIQTTMMEKNTHADFSRLNAIILKACQPDLKLRYQNAGQMLQDLQKTSLLAGLELQPS